MKRHFLIGLIAIIAPVALSLLAYNLVFFVIPLEPEQGNVVAYVQGDAPLEVKMSNRERVHLMDVRALIGKANVIFWLTWILLITLGVLTYRSKLIGKAMIAAGGATTGCILLLGAGALFGFSKIFRAFHKTFFHEGSWQFLAGSKIVRLFPSTFFQNVLLQIVILTLLIAVGTLVGGLVIRSRSPKD